MVRIRLYPTCPLNLEVTLCCGQAFRWEKQSEWWYGVTNQGPFKVRQIGEELQFENAKATSVRNYFGLDDNLLKIFDEICRDRHIKNAVCKFRGLRILRQDPWECLASYICATYKSIPAIKNMLLKLCTKFGDKVPFEGHSFFMFPSPERLAKANFRELAECGLGYRAKYICETSKIIKESNFDFKGLRRLPYEEAKKALLCFPGVGPKVADCVLLFSLGKLEAFPVDVWMRRVILRRYAEHFPRKFVDRMACEKSLSRTEYEMLSLFGRSYFGRYAGYAQEYLYHYERFHG